MCVCNRQYCSMYCSCPCHNKVKGGSHTAYPPPVSPYKTFYMIFVEGGGAPTVKHYDYDLAIKEAERLSKTLAKRVYVLTAFQACEISQTVWTAMAGNK